MRPARQLFTLAAAILLTVSCGGNASSPSASTTSSSSYDICNCTATASTSADYRHDAKHVDLPNTTPQEISVTDILGWPQGAAPPADAPRAGRELQLFHIARAYLQNAYVNPGDCDIHFEISQTPDPSTPRVIVETPDDPSYCSARQNIQTQLAAHGITFPTGGNLKPALPVEVLGLAFQDYEHNRGSAQVATTWELHPAVVDILPQ